MNPEITGKKAILFGGTDGHGVTMTVISEKNLEKEGYEVERVCAFKQFDRVDNAGRDQIPEDCGTGVPEYFWGGTFLNRDFSGLKEGDLIVVVDIPLPIQVNLGFSAADEAITKIGDLCGRGIRVILIDHHKRVITHYGEAIEKGAEVIFTLGAEQYCHYGDPDEYSRFWGALGAICDRDVSMLPVEDNEMAPFKEMEQYAAWIDEKKIDLPYLLDVVEKDRRDNFNGVQPIIPPDPQINGNVAVINRLDRYGAFKQLDAACATMDTLYGVGINYNCSAIHVINYWKKLRPEKDNRVPALPVALRLPQHREYFGHDTALTIKLPRSGYEEAERELDEIVDILNSKKIRQTTPPKNKGDAIDYIAGIFSEVPTPYFLTIHGWNHIETVLDNARILGMISRLEPQEQMLLDWSALFHDLGNGAMTYKQNYGLLVSDPDHARDMHELYTVQILTAWKKEGIFRDIISDGDLETISEMCYRHRKRSSLPTDPGVCKLCSLLRVADALDKTRNRARYNDDGVPYSEFKEKLEKEKPESIEHWEAQRAIDAIRLHVKKDRIVFEFLITDLKNAEMIIQDFEKELDPLKKVIPEWEIRRTHIPG